MPKVTNLSTLATRAYSSTPREAVIAAHAQDRGDLNTWEYESRYGSLVSVGQRTVCCGDWCSLLADATHEDELTGPATVKYACGEEVTHTVYWGPLSHGGTLTEDSAKQRLTEWARTRRCPQCILDAEIFADVESG